MHRAKGVVRKKCAAANRRVDSTIERHFAERVDMFMPSTTVPQKLAIPPAILATVPELSQE
jgi:hypothetical protein